jgi:hypothetical protein
MSETGRTFICLKWGTRYGPIYVNTLARSIRRFTTKPAKLVCFTDDTNGILPEVECHPLPEMDLPPEVAFGFFRKMCVYRDDLPLRGTCIYIDLDVAITGDLDPLFEFEPGKPAFIRNWYGRRTENKKAFPEMINGSVIRFEAGSMKVPILDRFYAERGFALKNFISDQGFLYYCLKHQLVYWPEPWCVSFKKNCIPRFPLNLFLSPKLPSAAKIVVFHGRPDPDEALEGYQKGRMKKWCRATPWIADCWKLE